MHLYSTRETKAALDSLLRAYLAAQSAADQTVLGTSEAAAAAINEDRAFIAYNDAVCAVGGAAALAQWMADPARASAVARIAAST